MCFLLGTTLFIKDICVLIHQGGCTSLTLLSLMRVNCLSEFLYESQFSVPTPTPLEQKLSTTVAPSFFPSPPHFPLSIFLVTHLMCQILVSYPITSLIYTHIFILLTTHLHPTLHTHILFQSLKILMTWSPY